MALRGFAKLVPSVGPPCPREGGNARRRRRAGPAMAGRGGAGRRYGEEEEAWATAGGWRMSRHGLPPLCRRKRRWKRGTGDEWVGG